MGIPWGEAEMSGSAKPVIDLYTDMTLFVLCQNYNMARIFRRTTLSLSYIFGCSTLIFICAVVAAMITGTEITVTVWVTAACHCILLAMSLMGLVRTTRHKNKDRREIMRHLIRVYGYPDNITISKKLLEIIR